MEAEQVRLGARAPADEDTLVVRFALAEAKLNAWQLHPDELERGYGGGFASIEEVGFPDVSLSPSRVGTAGGYVLLGYYCLGPAWSHLEGIWRKYGVEGLDRDPRAVLAQAKHMGITAELGHGFSMTEVLA